jgi:hypothetical protein
VGAFVAREQRGRAAGAIFRCRTAQPAVLTERNSGAPGSQAICRMAAVEVGLSGCA